VIKRCIEIYGYFCTRSSVSKYPTVFIWRIYTTLHTSPRYSRIFSSVSILFGWLYFSVHRVPRPGIARDISDQRVNGPRMTRDKVPQVRRESSQVMDTPLSDISVRVRGSRPHKNFVVGSSMPRTPQISVDYSCNHEPFSVHINI